MRDIFIYHKGNTAGWSHSNQIGGNPFVKSTDAFFPLERKRERGKKKNIYTHTHTHTHLISYRTSLKTHKFSRQGTEPAFKPHWDLSSCFQCPETTVYEPFVGLTCLLWEWGREGTDSSKWTKKRFNHNHLPDAFKCMNI